MMQFDGHVFIVTGACGGIGSGIARSLSARGARVALCDIRVDGGAALEAELGDAAKLFALDVTSPENWADVVGRVRQWAGRMDGLVNNAGIVNRLGVMETTPEAFDRVMAVNVRGAFLGIRAVVPILRENGGGSVVNIASHSAFTAHYDVSYTASKWALRGLTKAAAMEFAEAGIRVNSLCPGVVVTPINQSAPHIAGLVRRTPMGRPGTAEEMGRIVSFLLSEDATFITGEDIVADGGFIAGAAYRDAARESGRIYPKLAAD